jgi:hypothetical protein
MSTPKIAFALGGLAGNNSHGAGFLYAMLTEKIKPIKPCIISCTSGQIRWAYNYIKSKGNADHFLEIYKNDLKQSRVTGEPNLDLLKLMIFGFPGVFRPAYESWGTDIFTNGFEAMIDNFKKLYKEEHPILLDNLLSLTTSRTAISLLDDEKLDDISSTFTNSDIGIAFNSYDPIQGIEHVYLNDSADNQLQKLKVPNDSKNKFKKYRVYKKIEPSAVRDALWLYMYGFRSKEKNQIDGAFFRDVMLSELVVADIIFSARPINHKWKGKLPNTYQANEDMKTEISFNGCYSAERDQVYLINKLLDDNLINKDTQKGSQYHHIELVEVEIQKQRGFFEYALESQDVFDDAVQLTRDNINKLREDGKL